MYTVDQGNICSRTVFQMQLKNILTVTFARRNAYRLREGHYKFGIGTQPMSSTMRNRTLANTDLEERLVQQQNKNKNVLIRYKIHRHIGYYDMNLNHLYLVI